MSSTRSVMVSGLAAAIIAIALIGSVIGAGLLNTRTTIPSSTSSFTTVSSSPILTSYSSTSTATQPSTGGGTLAVLMTDPPTIPNGTSAVYITYSNLAIHVSGAGNNSGWHPINSQGQIDLMGIINATQTIASANIQSGTFNAMEFNISSAIVTFNGVNYTASLVYQEHMLYVPIVGGITITDGQTSAAVLDLTPTVLLLGTPASPSFAFIPSARAYTIPAQSISTHSLKVGYREDVHDQAWFQNIMNNNRFEISSVKLTPTSVAVTVSNTGSSSMMFRMVTVTSLASVSGGRISNLAALASISEIFVVYPNVTLVPLTISSRQEMGEMILAGGYLLPPQASVTFNYTGIIQTGMYQQSAQAVQIGGRYVVTVIANGFLAESLTVAQSG
ncbi:MAG: DUF4382 domain-containing protein [Nitrososphaerota archaeon]|nr:DUF4382 domain-containing protein [Nitrososphaerota archaeon]